MGAPQPRQHRRQRIDARFRAGEFQHVVAISSYEQRRLTDWATAPRRHQLRGLSDRTIPIESAGETGAPELLRDFAEILVIHPGRKRLRLNGPVKEAGTGRQYARDYASRPVSGHAEG